MKIKLILAVLLGYILVAGSAAQAQRLQAVHAAADPQLAVVDVYIGISILPPILLDDIPFKAAVPYTTVLANLPVNVGIAPANSTSVNDTLKNFTITLGSGLTYAGVVRGVVNPAQFAPNPDGRNTALSFSLTDQAREISTEPGKVQFIMVHAVSDAPTVDLRIRNGDLLVDNAAYGDISAYVTLDPAAYVFDITDAGGSNLVAAFSADLSAYADSALLVFAGGFLDPAQNQNGEDIGLYAVLPGGTVLTFPKIVVGIDGDDTPRIVREYQLAQNYPNPFNPSTTIAFQIADFPSRSGSFGEGGLRSAFVELAVYDISGRLIETLLSRQMPAGIHQVQWNAAGLSSGVYFYRLRASASSGEPAHFTATRKLMLLK